MIRFYHDFFMIVVKSTIQTIYVTQSGNLKFNKYMFSRSRLPPAAVQHFETLCLEGSCLTNLPLTI